MLSTTLRLLTTVSGLVCSALLFTGCSTPTPLQEEFGIHGRAMLPGEAIFALITNDRYPMLVNPMSQAEAFANIANSLQPDEAVVVITRRVNGINGMNLTVLSEGIEKPEYVGLTVGGVKILYKTKAGTKYFCNTTTAGDTDIVKIDLAPRKYYYLNVRDSFIPFDKTIAFDNPAEVTTEDIRDNLNNTEWRIANSNGFAFFERFRDYIRQQNTIGFDAWQQAGGTKSIKAEQGYDTLLEDRED